MAAAGFQRLAFTGCRNFNNVIRSLSSLTSEEAGRRAQEAVAALSSTSARSSLPTLLAHAGMENVHNAPMSPPLHLATTHTRPADGVYLAEDSKYGRMDNATRLLLEKTMFGLECVGIDRQDFAGHEEDAPTASYAFSSGMMAVTGLILAHNGPITVLLPDDVYHGVPTVLHNVFLRHNVSVKSVDMTMTSEITAAIENIPKENDIVVWIETPSNPMCKVFDIEAICKAVEPIRARRPNITTVVDVTMISPVIIRPLELGADVSMHSGTKYLAGHSDALLGVLSVSPKTQRGAVLAPILKSVQVDTGGIASPFDSWLALRGLRTLQVRVERQCQSAKAIADFLDRHRLVTAVHYPGLVGHPNHATAKRQMSNNMFGGVLSFELENEVVATAVAGALQVIQRATSLGGTETLIEHRASIEPPGRVTSPQGLLRLSTGLEDPKDLIHDLDRALSIAEKVVSEHN